MREKVRLTWSWWLVRMAMVVLLAPMAAFAAQEASKESLVQLFQVKNEASLVDQALESLSAIFAKSWQNETDPQEKAKKKEYFDVAEQTIRKHFNWSTMEPIAIECFQKRLQEDDVNALITYFGNPVGQLRVTKVNPALVKGLPQIMDYTNKRAEEIVERQLSKHPTKKSVAWKRPVAGTKEAAAFTLMLEMPGVRQAFESKMSNLEAHMLKNADMFTGAKGGSAVKSQFARVVKALKKEISFDEFAALYAKILADSLSDEEIATLIEDNRQPATKALLTKLDGAEHDMQARLSSYIKEKVLPELLQHLLNAKPEDKSES